MDAFFIYVYFLTGVFAIGAVTAALEGSFGLSGILLAVAAAFIAMVQALKHRFPKGPAGEEAEKGIA